MALSLSNLVNNLSEGLHRIKCKLGNDDKKCEICGIKYKYWDCFLEYSNFKDDLIVYKCTVACICHEKFHSFTRFVQKKFQNLTFHKQQNYK